MSAIGPTAPVPRLGPPLLRPPIDLRGVQIDAFLLGADAGALGRLVDRDLNGPAAGAARYEPLAPLAVLMSAEIARIGSLNPEDAQVGWFSEKEVAFWVPVWATAPDGSDGRLCWYIPAIYVDHPLAIAIGREVYGYPKQYGTLAIERNPAGVPLRWRLETWAYPTYSPQTEARFLPLVEVVRLDPPSDPIGETWEEFKDVAEDLIRLFRGGIGSVDGLRLLEESLRNLDALGFLNAFLKEFPPCSGNGSCYRAVVEAPARLTSFRSGHLLPGSYRVALSPYASHPIARDLGLGGDAVPALAAWHLDFDFVLDPGRVIASTP